MRELVRRGAQIKLSLLTLNTSINRALVKRYRALMMTAWLVLASQVQAQHFDRWETGINLGYNLARYRTTYLFETPVPYSFQVSWQRPLFVRQSLRQRYGLFDAGVLFLYHDFRKPELGRNYSIYATGSFYLNPPAARWQWIFRLGMGLAYNTHPYDAHNNTKNQLFGSHWLFPFNAGFYLFAPPLGRNWRLWTAFTVYHYSNGNLRAPNFGANLPGLSFGLAYMPAVKDRFRDAGLPRTPRTWLWTAGMRFGFNQSDFTGSGVYPFFIPAVSVERVLNFRHRIIITAELFVSYFLREQIRYIYYTYPEEGLQKIADFKRAGIYAAHEFHFGSFGIDLGFGYYLYYPYRFESRTYSRLGLRFFAGRHWRLRYGVKLHSFSRAEALELGLEYQFGKTGKR